MQGRRKGGLLRLMRASVWGSCQLVLCYAMLCYASVSYILSGMWSEMRIWNGMGWGFVWLCLAAGLWGKG